MTQTGERQPCQFAPLDHTAPAEFEILFGRDCCDKQDYTLACASHAEWTREHWGYAENPSTCKSCGTRNHVKTIRMRKL